MTSLIRPPHYSDHVKYVPNTAKVYIITVLIRPPHYSDQFSILPCLDSEMIIVFITNVTSVATNVIGTWIVAH